MTHLNQQKSLTNGTLSIRGRYYDSYEDDDDFEEKYPFIKHVENDEDEKDKDPEKNQNIKTKK